MKILVVADIDDYHWKGSTGKADLVISCGDVLDQVILEAAQAYSCNKIFAVKGNHDSDMPFPEPIKDLHLHVEEYAGLKFGGFNGSWKYKPVGYFLYDEWEAEQLLSTFAAVDIFVSHNSPRRIHDQEDEVHYGFEALNKYIHKVSPNLLIHGHQHINKESKLGSTTILGVFGSKLIDLQDYNAGKA